MFEIKCDKCHIRMDEPGALYFGIPDGDRVVKRNICDVCYKLFEALFNDDVDERGCACTHGLPPGTPCVYTRPTVPCPEPNNQVEV